LLDGLLDARVLRGSGAFGSPIEQSGLQQRRR
jgi:hypothetical protein